MIKPKEPKDWSFKELIEELERIDSRVGCGDDSKYYSLKYLKELYRRPASSPFTTDQIAWMRIENQFRKANYAARRDSAICLFEIRPQKDDKGLFWSNSGAVLVIKANETFLGMYLENNDPEPLCFADYISLSNETVISS